MTNANQIRAAARATVDPRHQEAEGDTVAVSNWASAAAYSVRRAEKATRAFAEQVVANPFGTMRWAHDFYTTTAAAEVGRKVVEGWKQGWDEEAMRAYAVEQMAQAVRGGNSTSDTMNAMSRAVAQAWTRYV